MGTEDLSTTAAVTPALAPVSAGAQKMSQATVDLVENSSNTLRNPETMQVDVPLDTSLAPEHREYLIHRHGTLDLDPMPGPGAADPYNWPHWRVSTIHSVVLVCTYTDLAISESGQPYPGGYPCYDVHLYRGCDHPGIPEYFSRPKGVAPENSLSYLPHNCNPGCSTYDVEATLRQIWTASNLSFVFDLQFSRQYWLR